MKTLRRFIDEEDMDFDEAAQSAVKKRKLLLNRVMQEKLIPDESDDDEEAKEEVEASVSYSESATWFLYEGVIVAFLLLILYEASQDELL